MADRCSEDWLPYGWTVSVHLRRNGKKDKHYLGPCGQKFYSKLEVMRHIKTDQCSPPQLTKFKDTICEESKEDAAACDVQKEQPNSQEKGQLRIELSTQNECPESEEKYYSAEETVEDEYGDIVQTSPLSSEDKGTVNPEQQAEHCTNTKSGEGKALGGEEFALNVSGSSLEVAKSNNEQSICSASRVKEVKNVNAEESMGQIFGNAAEPEDGSHQLKEGENNILEENKTDTCDSVGGSGFSKKMKKAKPKQSENIIVERGVAEGLPDGWIKEVKVQKKSSAVRKDSYYIDPVSGYIFSSMKDALRYLATGNIGRHAFKRKDIDECDAALEDSPVKTKWQKLHESGTNSEERKLKQTVLHSNKVPAGSIDGMCASDHHKLRSSRKNEDMKISNETDSTPANIAGVPQEGHSGMTGGMAALDDKDLNPQNELPLDNNEDTTTPAVVARTLRVEQSQENTEKIHAPVDDAGVFLNEHSSQRTGISGERTTPEGRRASRKKAVLDLPRRASNRLAGISVDPGADVIRTRAHQGTVRKLNEGEEDIGVKSVTARNCSQLQAHTKRSRRGSKLPEPMTSLGPSEAASEDVVKKPGRYQTDDEKRDKGATIVIQENVNFDENPNVVGKSEEKPVLPFELPSGDILSDPCIEFAIKTLTGIDFDTPKSTLIGSTGCNLRDAASERVRDQDGHIEIEREVDKIQELPDKNIPRVHNNEERAGADVPGSSLSDLPFGDSWQDPCIEFAIKTLTGAIPVEYNLEIEEIMSQQVRSSQILESNEVVPLNGEVDNLSRGGSVFDNTSRKKTASYRHYTEVVPVAQQPGNYMNLHRRGGAVLRPHIKN
ncbi:hypothetical protein SAY86_005810 [Trapa natans]|uniref:MBD domain-containing protein n=1 Tax=Trapa natans TaxID=22666 RepID=A0AAN7QSV3_TRANT|nr:hypothetical protein SAY86_005810 [Trapa natans]